MINICFVCLGNICRSPMAEFVMKDIVKTAGRQGEFSICSKATHSDNIWNGSGAPIYGNAQRCLAQHGIPFDTRKEATLLKKSDYEHFDYFIGMDNDNLYYMKKILGGDPQHKIHALMEFTAQGGEVADPWYTRNFERAYEDILAGCTAFYRTL